ncbi:MAG: hypothetical protein OHK0046_47700 [Anaerolineae bacterium]
MHKEWTTMGKGTSARIVHTPEVQAYLDSINDWMSARLKKGLKSLDMVLPLDERMSDSTVIANAVYKLRQALTTITEKQWWEYAEAYINLRAENEDKKLIYLTEETLENLEVIGEYLKDNYSALPHLTHGKSLNRKLIILFALQYTAENVVGLV